VLGSQTRRQGHRRSSPARAPADGFIGQRGVGTI
jgi:hypothetical protein